MIIFLCPVLKSSRTRSWIEGPEAPSVIRPVIVRIVAFAISWILIFMLIFEPHLWAPQRQPDHRAHRAKDSEPGLLLGSASATAAQSSDASTPRDGWWFSRW